MFTYGIILITDNMHRRTSQALQGATAPQTRANPLFFRQKLYFSGRSQQPKMKKYSFVVIKRKTTEFILLD